MRKLPVIALLRTSLSLTFGNLGPALRLSWAWLAILIAMTIAIAWIFDNVLEKPGELPDPAPILLTMLAFLAVVIVAVASIGVAWHRFVLLDEVPVAMYQLGADRTVRRYAGNMTLLFVGFVLAFSVPFAILMAIWETAIIFLLPGILVVSPFIYRLMLKLPAIALERTDFSFGDAWAATSGNYWQIMGLVTVYTIVALALNLLFTFVSGTALLAGVFGTLLGSAAGAAVQWLGLIFGISVLTMMYGFFVEERPL